MRFFGRYARIMRLTYLALVVIAAVLFVMHVQTQYRTSTRLMEERFRQTADSLDYFAKSVADHVEAMRTTAQRYWREDAPTEPYGGLVAQVRDREGGKHFDLDDVRPPFSQAEVGNLTGAGSFRGRSADYYRGARVALGLTPLYQTTLRNIPSVAWAYYTSVDEFILMYQWVRRAEYHYSEITHTGEFFTLGRPRENPQRRRSQ